MASPTVRLSMIIGIPAVLLGLAAVLLIFGHRTISDEVCRMRLHRLGLACVNWMDDNGRRSFPPITNGIPRTPWRPGRGDGIAAVLGPYLVGSAPLLRRRPGESDEAWAVRARDNEMSVDPATGFEFLYNQGELTGKSPGQLPTQRTTWIFRCQDSADGSPPYQKEGKAGRFQTVALLAEQTIGLADLGERRRELEALKLEALDRSTAELEERIRRLDAQVRQLERQLGPANPTVTVKRVLTEVEFSAD